MEEKRRRELPDAPPAENYLTPAQAGRAAPHSGRPYSPQTITRWIVKGAGAKDGTRVKLAAIRSPRGWLVSRTALMDFFAALTSGEKAEPAAVATERAGYATAWLKDQGF